jgi:hypothetical protein
MNLVGLLLVGVGLFTLAGAVFDWDWYMNNHRARLVVRLIGRTGARVFYSLIGLGIAFYGIALMLGYTGF